MTDATHRASQPDPADPEGLFSMPVEGLGALFRALSEAGYSIAGPRKRDAAIVYDEISAPEQLPVGWTEVPEAGAYTLTRRGDEARFGYVVGPRSWKHFLYPPSQRLWRASKSGKSFQIEVDEAPAPRWAFIGVRACDLAAIEVQDRVFLGQRHQDEGYRARREAAFIVAVQCGEAASTCFCASMGTGPRASAGFDLALTELIDSEGHGFVVEVGSERGAEVARRLPLSPASSDSLEAAQAATRRAQAQMGREIETEGLAALLTQSAQSPRWEEVARRCLSCANCTMVCPTCFCSTVEDVTDLRGEETERVRSWDSCFTMDFSYVHGGSVRQSTASRYRHWITHKLSTWWDQFGTGGCVGCGRCIAWCPVGIDITEEVARLRRDEEVAHGGS